MVRVGYVVLALCFVLTLRQAFVWSTEQSLWARAVQVSPHAPGPHLALGRAYQHLHDYENASREYIVALHYADESQELREYRFTIGANMAKLMAEQHRTDQALNLLNTLSRDYPEASDYLTALKVTLLLQSGMTCRTIHLLQLPCAITD